MATRPAKQGNAWHFGMTAALADIFLVRYTVLGAVRPKSGNRAKRVRFRLRSAIDPLTRVENRRLAWSVTQLDTHHGRELA
jgi:hypothetical protein